jgi:hypothetical protein
MEVFRVWVQAMDYEYRVAVDGAKNARWLLERLSRAFVFKSAMPMGENSRSTLCTFQVPYNAKLPFAVFRKLLSAIPEVSLVMQPVLAVKN